MTKYCVVRSEEDDFAADETGLDLEIAISRYMELNGYVWDVRRVTDGSMRLVALPREAEPFSVFLDFRSNHSNDASARMEVMTSLVRDGSNLDGAYMIMSEAEYRRSKLTVVA